MKTVGSALMRELDRRSIEEAEIPGTTLMSRAGIGAAEYILDFVMALPRQHAKRIILLAGKGNNGGDAYVAADWLARNTDLPISIYALCAAEKLSPDARHHAEAISKKVNCEIRKSPQGDEFRQGDIIVDGLLGTGIRGPLRPPYDLWVASVNESECPVIALDIPSGLDGDDGKIASAAIRADLTLTMGLPKSGLIKGEGPACCGRLRLINIGIPENYINEAEGDAELIMAEDIRPLLKRLPADTHKGRQGRVLIIGGSRDYRGAPVLAGLGALRGGAGLVTMAVPATIGELPNTPAALIIRRINDDGSGAFSPSCCEDLQALINQADVLLIGPGISLREGAGRLLQKLLTAELPAIIDADALTLLAGNDTLTKRHYPTILTPHPGEMRRLMAGYKLESADASREEQARILSEKTGSITVLKGHRTIVAAPGNRLRINGSGCPALASGGTGDVLAGLTAGILADASLNAFDASTAAVFIHGYAAEISAQGERGLIADDLVELLPTAMREISPFA